MLRRVSIGLVLSLVFGGLVALAFRLMPTQQQFLPPSYSDLDPTAPAYWKERTLLNIEAVKSTNLSENKKKEYLHDLVAKDIQSLQKMQSPHQRVLALTNLAMTLAENNQDIIIDDALRNMDESDLGNTMRARVFVSQALMHLRLNNKPAVRVAISEYLRLLVSADLKLENDINEMSFIGAVTVLYVMDDIDGLNDLFRKQLSYTLRVGVERQMRAYRVIAGEQARVQHIRQAVDTIKWITDHVELARACQLIISFAARPIRIEPKEPVITIPIEDTKTPLANRSVTLNITNEIIRRAAAFETIDDQIDLLMRIAGSQLMCDKDIYNIFKDAIKDTSSLDELVKRPVLRLLDEPLSPTIRVALNMKPIENVQKQKADTALDDWVSSYGGGVQAIDFDPDQMRLISDLQTFRSLSMVSQSYLIAARRRDAVRVLSEAVEIAKNLSHPIDRINSLLVSSDQFISAGDSASAGRTLVEVGLPEERSDISQDGRETTVYSEVRLSELARLQIIARFFDDAQKTIDYIGAESIRNDDYMFLARELLRIRRSDLAETIAEKMPSISSQNEIEHCLAIARAENRIGKEEDYVALNIPYPPTIQDDGNLQRCSNMLVRKGLLESAATIAKRIDDLEKRSQTLARIAREYILLFNAYRGNDENHLTIRKDLLDWTMETAEPIPDAFIQATIWQEIISGALTYTVKDESMRKRIQELLERVLNEQSSFMQNKSEMPNDVQAELMIRLISLKLMLAIPETEMAPVWPLIHRETDQALYDEIKKKIDSALLVLNDSDTTVNRGLALANLAKLTGQIGRMQSARSLINAAEDTANDLSDTSLRVSILLDLIPTMQELEEIEMVRSTFHRAFMLASDSFVSSNNDNDKTMQWRQRDMELDRIVREQIRLNYLPDAVGFASLINEPMIKDRLLRSIAYIFLDQKKFAEAEAAARRINTDSFRIPTIRNILFMKKAQPRSKANTENTTTAM